MKKFDKKEQIRILKIILILMWMIIVFMFSEQVGIESGNTSKTVTVVIIQILTGNKLELNAPFIEEIQLVIRKLAHFAIYTIGGFLIMNYEYTKEKTVKQKVLYSIILGGLYAVTDEIHQLFVPGRSGNIIDVGIDTLGVITGGLIYLALRKIIKK